MKLITLENLKSFWKDVKSYVDNGLSKKADSVHGTHVTYGTINGKAPGTPSAGTSSKVAREDHVHPVQTTVSGNAGTATKLQTARTITLKGRANGSASFDGSGNIIIDTNPKMFESGGTSGTSGYVAVAQLKITGSYANRPTEFKLASRGRETACTVSVAFANADSTDPALSSIRYWGTNYGVFIHKSATSTWLLYATKSEAHDSITVVDCCYGSQSITITYPGSFITEKPTSNITNASLGGSFGQANTANSATKATQDSAGQQINTTYIKGLSVNGKTITYTKGDGSTGTITTQDTNTDTNTTYTLSKSGSTITLTGSDGKTTSVSDSNTTYSTGTTSASGLTKLYTGTGTATDGTMTQSAIKTALDSKAASSHTHSYLPLSGGTLSGILNLNGNNLRLTSEDTYSRLGYEPSTKDVFISNSNNNFFRLRPDQTIRFGGKKVYSEVEKPTAKEVGAVAKTGDTMTGLLTIDKKGKDEPLLRFDTERGWEFKQLEANADARLGLVSMTSDKNFEILPPDLSRGVRIRVSNTQPAQMTVDGTVISNLQGNASTATKATQDSAGQQINKTYIKGLSVSGKTITYTKGDGTTGTITTQDTNTTYSTGTASALGLTKLYTGTGTATDGTMTQAAIKTALDGKANSGHTHNYAGSSSAGGAANSATTLQTARTINGTSFNGSANITTANWGTARTLTIGNTGKSVNGSANVSWTLSEIGAASSSHNHTTLTSVSSINFTNATISNVPVTDTLQINGTTNGVGALKLSSGGCRIYGTSSSTRLYVEGGFYTNSTIEGGSSAIFNGACYPGRSQQAGWDCGLKDRRWYTVYCVGVSQSSDRSMKKDIKYIENDIASMSLSKNKKNKVSPTKFKDFIANELKIATYKYKREFKEYDEDGNVISVKELPNEETDSQIGFIAQDIRDTEVGSMFVYGEDGDMNYSPSGFTTVVAKALQEEIKSRDIIINNLINDIKLINDKIGLLEKEINLLKERN